VDASDAAVWEAVKRVTPGEIRGLGWLMAMRTLSKPKQDTAPVLQFALQLEELAPREVVLGLVGQFWKLDGGPRVKLREPADFAAFARPGFLRVAVNFTVGNGMIATETRIQALDDSARRKFSIYWTLIRPGSGWIRMAWLRAIRRRALPG
jgi:hypothetical protein